MYLKPQFEERRPDALHGLMRAHPLATFVVSLQGEIVVDHLPFLVSADVGEHGMLMGHLPRANPLWRVFDQDTRAVAVFHGPQSYITPSWYPSKRVDGKVVPTWNYAVVHAHGCPRVIDDANWLLAHLRELTDAHESKRAAAWKLADAPREFTALMLRHIVGIELPIDAIVGKWKVSQNRPPHDRLGVAEGLGSAGDATSLAMEALVMQYAEDAGNGLDEKT
jgi:transcriptional regulator